MKNVKSYAKTSVNWGKSQANICKLLEKNGIEDVRFTYLSSSNELVCEFNYPSEMQNKKVNIGIRILLPLPKIDNKEQAKNQIHRALFYYLKSKFEAMNFGLVEFSQEFMAHLVIRDKTGNTKTLYQLIGQQYKDGLICGKTDIKMLTE